MHAIILGSSVLVNLSPCLPSLRVRNIPPGGYSRVDLSFFPPSFRSLLCSSSPPSFSLSVCPFRRRHRGAINHEYFSEYSNNPMVLSFCPPPLLSPIAVLRPQCENGERRKQNVARRYGGGRKKLNYRSRRRLNKVVRPTVRRKCDKNLTPPHKAPSEVHITQ